MVVCVTDVGLVLGIVLQENGTTYAMVYCTSDYLIPSGGRKIHLNETALLSLCPGSLQKIPEQMAVPCLCG